VNDYRNHIDAVIHLLQLVGREILMPAFHSQCDEGGILKRDGSVVTETDIAAQHRIREGLAAIDADIGFLGEEMEHGEQLKCLQDAGRFWCVDPLDGTGNFTTPMPIFASSVALIEHGAPVLACVHDPVRGETFHAIRGHGAFLNGHPIHTASAPALKQSIGFIDFKRLQAEPAARLATGGLYRSQRNLGSCALEWGWLAAGRAQFIIHGGEKVWDYAGGYLLVNEAGGHVSDFTGRSPFHTPQLSSPILAAADTPLHAEITQALQSVL
jgi:myo-inositol-1(or 4)-monophosphatase